MYEALNEFYTQNCLTYQTPVVFSEMDMSVLRIQEISSKILRKVGNVDGRFKGQEVEVGSYATGTTSVVEDECDMLIPVKIDGDIEPTDNPEYVRFKLCKSAKETWKDCENENGYFEPMLFSRTFYRLVETVLEEVKTETGLQDFKLKGLDTVAATIIFPYLLLPIEISVDLVAAIQCSRSPPWQLPEWFDTKSRRPWPKENTIKLIQERGIELVAKPFQDKHEYWRLSFSQTETELINDVIDTYPIFGKLMVIFKALNKLYLCPTVPNTTPVLKSYHFKILLLHEAVEFPSQESWTEEKLVERFLSILKRFENCIKREKIAHLFLPEVNLFNYGSPSFCLHHELLIAPLAFLAKVKSENDRGKAKGFRGKFNPFL